jgi:hypothetical protein
MHKFIIATLTTLSLFSISSAFAADRDSYCYKAFGNTPNEAFRAATEVLKNADAEMGPRWMKDNMQIRLLPKKIQGQFVAVIYSTVHHADGCDLDKERNIAEQPRPKCDNTRCLI